MSATTAARRVGLDREQVLWGGLLVNAEILATVAYLALAPVTDVGPVFLAIPFVWINVSLWALTRIDAPAASRRVRWAAGAVASVYFVVLGYAGGVFGTSHSHVFEAGGHTHGGVASLPTLEMHWVLPPGWGPLVDVSWLGYQAMLFPFKVVGYAVLAYLVYATLVEAVSHAVGGVVGLFACVSCAWPVLGSFAASVFGSGSVVVTVATEQPYQASTVVFVTAVALLLWRPRF